LPSRSSTCSSLSSARSCSMKASTEPRTTLRSLAARCRASPMILRSERPGQVDQRHRQFVHVAELAIEAVRRDAGLAGDLAQAEAWTRCDAGRPVSGRPPAGPRGKSTPCGRGRWSSLVRGWRLEVKAGVAEGRAGSYRHSLMHNCIDICAFTCILPAMSTAMSPDPRPPAARCAVLKRDGRGHGKPQALGFWADAPACPARMQGGRRCWSAPGIGRRGHPGPATRPRLGRPPARPAREHGYRTRRPPRAPQLQPDRHSARGRPHRDHREARWLAAS
jgi:hypothetical protein